MASAWVTQAQYSYKTNADGTITVVGYHGSGGSLTMPDKIDGLSVSSIGFKAFLECQSVTSITIPECVTSIGELAFEHCCALTNVTIPNSVTNIGIAAFDSCVNLTSVAMPNSVTRIEMCTFNCTSLTNVTIPGSVSNIGIYAFNNCTNLTRVYFTGNAPSFGSSVFAHTTNAIIYYLPRTTGWSTNVASRPTAVWKP